MIPAWFPFRYSIGSWAAIGEPWKLIAKGLQIQGEEQDKVENLSKDQSPHPKPPQTREQHTGKQTSKVREEKVN